MLTSRIIRHYALLISVMCLGAALSDVSAQQPVAAKDVPAKPMTLTDLIGLDRLGSSQVSDDGSVVLYSMARADWGLDRAVEHLWIRRLKENRVVPLTNGASGETQGTLSPNGARVAFLAERAGDKDKQIYVIPTTGGEALRFTQMAATITRPQWSPRGEGLYFLASDAVVERDAARKAAQDDMVRFDADTPNQHLYYQSLLSTSATKVTAGAYSISRYEIAPSGRFAVLTRAPSPYLNDRSLSELYLLDLETGEQTRLTDNDFEEQNVDISADGTSILFTASASPSEGGFSRDYVNAKLFTRPLAQPRAAERHLEDQDFELLGARFKSDGRIILHVNEGSQNSLLLYTPSQRRLKTLHRPSRQTVTDWSYNRSADLHSMRLEGPDQPSEIYVMRGSRSLQAVTAHHQTFRKRYLVPKVQRITWTGADGTEIEGFLTLPLGYKKGTRYPLVVQTHGGPTSSDQWAGFSVGRYKEVMAAKGYAVLEPNYRGSTGYGDRFLRDMIAANGGYFNQAHLDVMTGVDALIDRGIADPDKLIKMGWSAGGHMTNKIITHTNRFKAASSGAGAVNWTSMIGQSDVRVWRKAWFGDYPHAAGSDPSLYLKNSPLFDLHKVTTPTLILVGEKDVRVPPAQSQELHNALKALNVPTAFYIAPDEGHSWKRLSHQLFKANTELDWFAKHALRSASDTPK